jgi:Protein of unknown function (DUF3892)
MAQRVRIDCITKADRYDPHRHITHIGGPQPTGTGRFKIPEEGAIQGIKDGTWSFYVQAGGRTVDVVIERHSGREFLKTESDGYRPDNLLSLPECQ